MNNTKNQNNKQTELQKRMPDKSPLSIWRIIFAFLLFWLIFNYFNQEVFNKDTVSISYSEFLEQLESKNISRVTFKGDELSGTFKSKYLKKSTSDSSVYKYFNTVKPSANPQLLGQLKKNNVTIYADQENGWFNIFLVSVLPWILIFAIFYFISRRIRGQSSKMLNSGFFNIRKSRAKRYKRSDEDTTFRDVAGLENAKTDLQEIVQYLKTPAKFAKLGARIPKGVLLIGAPGTGKTLLARATAGEAGVSFFSISGSEFIEMFVGIGASRVRDMFTNAKKEAPSIIFIDEIDSVGRSRGTGLGGGHDEREQTLNQILSEMDGFEDKHSVVVIAATNRPDVLDPALTRPGRFDRRILLNLPHRDARKKILEIHTRHVPLADDVNLDNIAARTVSFSGADIKNLVNEAALLAGRQEKQKVDSSDFDTARDKILLGNKREFMISDEEKKVIACHEAGHALIAKLLPDADPLQKVTIIPHGKALGVTEQLSEKEIYNLQRHYLLNRILVALGGRSAEKIVFGEVSNGAANDLKHITSLVRQMVCHWGMSENIGPVYYKNNESHPFLGKEITQNKDYSEYTARKIDEEVHNVIIEMENKALDLLKNNHKRLDRLAKKLLEEETLDRQQVDEILKIEEKEREELVLE